MRPAAATFLLITPNRVARADFDGPLRASNSAPRPAGTSAAEAVRIALTLAVKAAARETWVLSTDTWTQEVKLNAAQIAGLTPEQLGRALAFEAEPFSGIPVSDSATGFREEGGRFNVVQMPRAELDGIARAISGAGGRLSGVAHPGIAPEDDDALLEWWGLQPARVASAPVIAPPASEPSRNRFLIAGLAFEAAAIALLFLLAGWNAVQRRICEGRNAEFAAVTQELDAANKRNDTLRKELAIFEKQEEQREQVDARRGAVLALLNTLASSRLEDVVVRGLTAEGPSSVVVSGLSLEAGAVDELSIVLTQQLRAAGWTAQPRSKTGKKNMANGGPWEFALVLTHEEAARAQSTQLSQRSAE
jgi:hypothetical protein